MMKRILAFALCLVLAFVVSFSVNPNHARADGSVPAKKIKLKDQSITINLNEQYRIQVAVSPKNASTEIYWTSSDVNIATVDTKGIVTGKSSGTVMITATTASGKTASCQVTVLSDKDVRAVKLSEEKVTINPNEYHKIYVAVSPSNAADKTITWSSSDSNIASVDKDGMVQGKSKGTVTITAKSHNGKKATCKVTVTGTVNIEKIKLSKKNVTIYINGQYQLKVAVSPANSTNKKITWESSDSSIAAVDQNGNVTGKKVGKVTITAKSSNGKTATCAVEVKKVYVGPNLSQIADEVNDMKDQEITDDDYNAVEKEVESVVIVRSGILPITFINFLGKPVTVKAKCMPEGSDQTIFWSSSNPNVATVSSEGVVTPTGYGDAIITATSKNGKSRGFPVLVKKDNKFEKTISHTNEVISGIEAVIDALLRTPVISLTAKPVILGAKASLNAVKWVDHIEIHVDGLTGKIYNIKKDQTIHGFRIVIIVNPTKYSIEKTYECDDYVEFVSQATLAIGVGVGDIKGDLDVITRKYTYRLYANGTFEQVGK